MKKIRASTIASAIKDNPLKAWMIMYGIWLIDLASTAIALVVIGGNVFFEANPFAAWFMAFGGWGWFIWAIVCGIIIYLILMLPNIFLLVIGLFKSKKEHNNRKRTADQLRLLSFFGLIFTEGVIIIHNIYLLFKYIIFL